MRSGIVICVLLLFLSLPLAGQEAANADSQRTKILALENAWNRAEESKDVKALDGLLASTLVYVDYDGTLMDKAKFIASVKAPSLHPEQIVNESMTAYLYGDSAVVTESIGRRAYAMERLIHAADALRIRGSIRAGPGFVLPANRR